MGVRVETLSGAAVLGLLAAACGSESRGPATVVDVPSKRPAPAPTAERGCQAAHEAPPDTLHFVWPGRAGEVNPRPVDRSLALFEDDAYNRALTCPRVARPAESGADAHLCPLAPAASIRVGTATLWTAMSRYTHEWDGMYGFKDDVVLAVPATPQPRPIHTLAQWNQSVVDCGSELTMRRQQTVDLDGDGCLELCVETVEEAGVGLFEVIDRDPHAQPWRPVSRMRSITAWRFVASQAKLVRARALDDDCPRSGYAFFVPREDYGDALTERARVQGDDVPLAPCPAPSADSCFDPEVCKKPR